MTPIPFETIRSQCTAAIEAGEPYCFEFRTASGAIFLIEVGPPIGDCIPALLIGKNPDGSLASAEDTAIADGIVGVLTGGDLVYAGSVGEEGARDMRRALGGGMG